MATATIGMMQKFQAGAKPIMAYLKRLQAYLDANNIAQANWDSVLHVVSTIGHKTYAVLHSLTAPDNPQEKSYDDLIKALKNHYQPKWLIIAERYLFNQRSQHPGESIADYVVKLCLASTCDFSQFLDDTLRNCLVCGLSSEVHIANSSLTQKTTFAKVVELAQIYEQAHKNAKSCSRS